MAPASLDSSAEAELDRRWSAFKPAASSLDSHTPPADLKAAGGQPIYVEDTAVLESPMPVGLIGKSAPSFVEKPLTQDGASGKDVEQQPVEEEMYPDGGLRAWLVVMGAWSISFVSYGLVNSWGVFQAYYRAHQLSDYSPDAVAWIGSVQICLVLGVGLMVGRAFDHGHLKPLIGVAMVIYCAGLFSIPHCTTYWQFFLAQGIACGLGPGLAFLPAIGCISHWFRRRRSAALGIFSSGAAVGGVVYPIMLRNLFQSVGFAWAVRAVGFLTLALLIGASFALKQRLPPRHGGRFFDHRVFRDPAYSLLTVGAGLAMGGFYLPLVFLQQAAVANNLKDNISYYCLAMASGASGFGRIAPNYLADSIGPLNVLCANCTLLALTSFLFSTMVKSDGGAVAFAVIFGFASGCQVAITPPCIASITKNMQEIGIRISMCYLVVACLALPGPPVGGLIVSHTGSYLGASALAGGLVSAGLFLFLGARMITARRKGTPWV